MARALKVLRKTASWLPCVVLLACPCAHAGGPRFVTGTQYSGAPAGQLITFYTPNPLYFTDPGDLSSSVTHAQADAMVAAAANSWNVPTSLLTFAQGGALAEHVSSANSYDNGTSVVFPADVQATNYAAIQIAIIYDTDGSVTDLLLGSGASDPSGCRQNAVTESVDGFGQTGTIEHAVIVLNGLCAGTTPQQLLQMQYQLMRTLGRVIGMAWSQLNDNVFTGIPTPNGNQFAFWPIMHPIDVLCGPYSYQCMANPFTLRVDELSALTLLYPVTAANVTPGKTISLAGSASIYGGLFFPTQQGMDMLNVTVTAALFPYAADDYERASAVTGILWQQDLGNPVTERTVAAANNVGANNGNYEAIFSVGRIPLAAGAWTLGVVSEAINPLYWGDSSIAPYESFPVAPSGAAFNTSGWFPSPTSWRVLDFSTTAADACSSSGGRETAPAAVNSTGWWSDLVCAAGHSSWFSASIKAQRSWTLEVTAISESGANSAQKLRPVIGVWNATDPTGTLPTVAASQSPLNATTLGMTQLLVPAAATRVRVAVADLLGQGRPDFAYNGRLLYADSIQPAVVGASGGRITITGTGFRNGNEVLVNGVSASVISWSATQIVATAPTMAAAGASSSTSVDVEVLDPSTDGQTVMSGVLSYSAALADTIVLVSAPTTLATGIPGATPFAVRVFASDGVTAIAGASVQFTVPSGAVTYGVCDAGACVVTTDATGLVQTVVTGDAGGSILLKAQEMSGGASVEAIVNDVDPGLWTLSVASGAGQSVEVGEALTPVVLLVSDGAGHPLAGVPVNVYQTVAAWEGACPAQGPCPGAPVIASSQSLGTSDANGLVAVTPMIVAGIPQRMNIAATAGTQGFVALSLIIAP